MILARALLLLLAAGRLGATPVSGAPVTTPTTPAAPASTLETAEPAPTPTGTPNPNTTPPRYVPPPGVEISGEQRASLIQVFLLGSRPLPPELVTIIGSQLGGPVVPGPGGQLLFNGRPLSTGQVAAAIQPQVGRLVADLADAQGRGRANPAVAYSLLGLAQSAPGLVSDDSQAFLGGLARAYVPTGLSARAPWASAFSGRTDVQDALASANPMGGAAARAVPTAAPAAADPRRALEEALRGLAFTTPDGRRLTYEQARASGNAVLVKFTGSWCPHCNTAEMHRMVGDLQSRLAGRGLSVLGVSVDFRPTPQHPTPEAFARASGIPLAQVTSEQAGGMGADRYPSFAIIGRDGLLAWRQGPGEALDPAALSRQLELALNPARGPPPAPTEDAPASTAHGSSVRIRADYGTSSASGSGTIIGRRENADGTFTYTVVTAAHVVSDHFENWRAPRGMRVEGLVDGRMQEVGSGTTLAMAPGDGHLELAHRRVNGQIVDSRYIQRRPDIALLRFTSRESLPVAPVVGPGYQASRGQDVLSVGFDGGGPYVQVPTRLNGAGTNWHGLDVNIEATPGGGRSGGGLFNPQGQLMGVCWGGGCGGSYVGPDGVHQILDGAGLGDLYKSVSTSDGTLPATPPAWWTAVRAPREPAPGAFAYRGPEPPPSPGGTPFFGGASGSCGPGGCSGAGGQLAGGPNFDGGGSCPSGGCGGGRTVPTSAPSPGPGGPSSGPGKPGGGKGPKGGGSGGGGSKGGGAGAESASKGGGGWGCAGSANAAGPNPGPADVGGLDLWLLTLIAARRLRRRPGGRTA
ncbi:MAG TPA: trypsin-like peptidase domain-containing protein [Elusimicrobiota bacterium]|jgi:hypothetical protein|nr:trypsin-like peptidase domain-containing protein [Elusimicrobiota bacterium]